MVYTYISYNKIVNASPPYWRFGLRKNALSSQYVMRNTATIRALFTAVPFPESGKVWTEKPLCVQAEGCR